MVMGVVGIVEYTRLTGNASIANRAGIVATSLDVFAMLWLTSMPLLKIISGSSLTPVILVGAMILAIYLLSRFTAALYVNVGHSTRDTAYSVAGVMYVATGIIAAQLLSIYSTQLVLLLFIYIWLNDTGAFIIGSLIGKHRLFERLSPKKSWEGFFGGLALVLIASLALGYTGVTMRWLGTTPYFGVGPYMIVYGLPLVAVIFSTLGDLYESMIKRSVGAKDSGRIIPGHGGLLDRIDSMLFVMPAAAIFILACILI